MVKAVCFDLDGTLYPYRRMLTTAMPLSVVNPGFFLHFVKVRVEIRTIRPIVNFRQLQAELLAQRMSVPVAVAWERIERIVYRRLIRAFRTVRPFPFMRETLTRLSEEGFRLGVLSDFPVQEKLSFLGLNHIWDCSLCSEEAQYLKPNPEPFLMLAERLELKTEEILYVGDRYHSDIVGAYKTGMSTAHLSRKRRVNSLADITFSSYKNFFEEFTAVKLR